MRQEVVLLLSVVIVFVLIVWAERRDQRRRIHAGKVELAEAWQHRRLIENKVIAIRANHRRPT